MTLPPPSSTLLRLLLLGVMPIGSLCAAEPTANPAEAERAKLEFFEKEVRPILATHCYECHGEEKQKAGLRLDNLADILLGGDTGPALVRGKPHESLLIEAVHYTNEDLQMPPEEQLGSYEVEVLEKWITLGAPWPAKDSTSARPKAAKDAYGFTAEDRAYWAFQPVAAVTPPILTDGAARQWASTEIDQFVAAKHVEHGLKPAPAADRRELVRRIYFDLHGLPPTREQSEAFVHDSRPDAYARLIDSLLASPRYGERWAQHWLDLVRYSESDGYRADFYRPGAWAYRDYVIKSFNTDKPYDQFVREQLAGDEIAPDDPEILIATSYLRNPVYEWNQRDVHGQAALMLNDMTDNAGEVFLGLSMGCARCHDHKFDPILQKDYFSLRAFFEPVLWRTDLKLATKSEAAQHAEKLKAWETATAEIRAEMDALTRPELEKLVKRAYDRFSEEIRGMLDKSYAERAPHERILAAIAHRQIEYEYERFDPLKALKTPDAKARYHELEAKLKPFASLKPAPLLDALVATDAGPKAPVTRMKARKGEVEVAPGFLSLLDPNVPSITPRPESTGRRTALAEWITRPDNPLSTRVIVNRVWQYHFGRGLAGVPNDFGRLGEAPTHPELLDWLTRRFVAGGWSIKALHRDILLSATYQQTARHTSEQAALVDPDNKYLWRYSPRRLDAEQARDAILAATGELDLTEGGPSQDANTSARRSIYTIKKRNNQNELLRSLDAPAGFSSTAERQRTATPLQVLLFLNGEWTIARARQLASTAPTLEDAWQATLGRPPEPEERQLAQAFIAQRIASDQPLPDAPALPLTATDVGVFHENTPQERLLTRAAPREGDDFTVEAIVTVESIDAGASVRTIASRWNGDKNAIESHGWSLGVTGAKSAFKPRNVIVQLVGEDTNMNTTYEVLASGLHLELQRPYHVFASVSCTDHTATFTVRDLSEPNSPARTATVKHGVVGKLGIGQGQPVIGGLSRRSPHQFDGRIDAVRIYSGTHEAPGSLVSNPRDWTGYGLIWRAAEPLPESFSWSGGTNNAESRDPRVRALADLGHVLLNSNEFIYLH